MPPIDVSGAVDDINIGRSMACRWYIYWKEQVTFFLFLLVFFSFSGFVTYDKLCNRDSQISSSNL